MAKTLQHLQTPGTTKALMQTGAETCIFNIRYLISSCYTDYQPRHRNASLSWNSDQNSFLGQHVPVCYEGSSTLMSVVSMKFALSFKAFISI